MYIIRVHDETDWSRAGDTHTWFVGPFSTERRATIEAIRLEKIGPTDYGRECHVEPLVAADAQ